MATFTNQATLRYNGVVTNSNIATGELLETLSVTKTALVPTYGTGDEITYVVSILNSGPTAFTGLTLTDDLGGYEFNAATVYPLAYAAGSARYYVNGVLQNAPTVTAGPPLTVTGLQVPAGGNAIVVYQARTTGFADPTATGSIVNTATVSGGGITPVSATATATPDSAADLTISKSVNPTVVTENSRLTYTFTVYNYGNTAANTTDGAAITDTFNPLLSDLAVAFNGTVWTEPAQYTYDAVTGQFATQPGQITVPAATYTRDATGNWVINPGISTLTVTGTV